MGGIFNKIVFFLFTMPFMIGAEAYKKFKKIMAGQGYHMTWVHDVVIGVVLFFLLVWLIMYGYR